MFADRSPSAARAALSPGIVVVGSYNVDTAVELRNFPIPGETVLAGGVRKSHGGKGSNQATQAARCGGQVAIVGCVGDDPAGEAAIDFWRLEGIHVEMIDRDEALPTGSATILVDSTGENIIVVHPGANLALEPQRVASGLGSLVAAPKLVVTQLETPVAVAQAAFRRAREAHAVTLLNAAPLNAPPPAMLISLTDILIVNEIEALALVGTLGEDDAHSAAQRLASQVGAAVVLTQGASGATLYRSNSAPFHLPSPQVEVRDTTGAGDAFIGAFAAEFAAGGSLEKALAWGVAAGAFACQGHGAVPSYGTRAEILTLASGLLLQGH